MGKFCLEDNDFTINVRETFKNFRENRKLFDVTLATDDGQHLEAHKIILSTGSHFFNDIFMKSNHTNMLVYLKGISSNNLEHVVEFLYKGVTSIPAEELKEFLETGKELGVKGLQCDAQNSPSELSAEKRECKTPQRNEDGSDANNDSWDSHELSAVSENDTTESITVTGTVVKTEDIELQVKTNEEIGNKIEQMIRKVSDGWNCNICGRISTTKQLIKSHAGTHIEGISHECHICSKTFSVKRYLKQHISNVHSESSFSCELCGKSEMSKGQQYKHKCQNLS